MSNRDRGKRTERDLAKRLGGKRVGILGSEDISHDWASFEVKNRVKSTVHGFMEQCTRNCPQGKVPIVIVHKHGERHGNDLVCMKLVDWEAWQGELKGYPE